MNAAELDRYLARVGYRGPREPTLALLHALTAAHTQSIPFENLDVLLDRPIDLSDEAVFDKLVERRRGGYCFEQNALFLQVLTALGFSVTPLSARVRTDRPREFMPPRTHLFVRVELDGAIWLTDVGVGAASLTGALRFALDVEQTTPHDTRRIIHEDGRFFVQVLHGAVWTDVYEFTGEMMQPIDRVVGNWYTSAHPASHFKNRLIVTRAAEAGRRYTILNAELKVRERDGQTKVRPIDSPEQLLELLNEHFGLRFPADTRFGVAGSPWPR